MNSVPDKKTGTAPSVANAWDIVLSALLWLWAIWACAEHWRGNPNYSFGWVVPPLALGFGIRRWFLSKQEEAKPRVSSPSLSFLPLSLATLGLTFVLEWARQEVWHPQIVLTTICVLAAGYTFLLLYQRGRLRALWLGLFPILFFFTAVPWPPRVEQPITSGLMWGVAQLTAEILHWLGIEATTAGAAIALPNGLVGITEACSGIRSLQAAFMFGLAMGEWFLLSVARRVVLLLVAFGLAMLTNLARTLCLSLQAVHHGIESIEQVHDLAGNITMTALVAGIWFLGWVMSARKRETIRFAGGVRLREFLFSLRDHSFSPAPYLVLALALGLISSRVVYARLAAADRMQTAPYFATRPESSHQTVTLPREIVRALNPTSGTYIRRIDPTLPLGYGDGYHFYWKPSPWNRFVLVHRPDICMPGVGWTILGQPEAVEVILDGKALRFYAFRFRKGQTYALELWGVWRNGEAVSVDYDVAQALGTSAPPPDLPLGGKRRSATEIVACSIMQENAQPDIPTGVRLVQSLFSYANP